MSGFSSPLTGDFDKYFMTSTELIDRYAIGGLWSWGINTHGQLGDNTIVKKSSPVQTIATGSNWKQVACGGGGHTAAIKTDGTLWLCGYNPLGQLGDNTSVKKSSPVQTIAFGTNWKQVACGGFHTAAIKTDGTLWTWGDNSWGALGDNTSASKSSPVQTITFGANWKQVAGGYYHTAAIKTDGTLWLWGRDGYGQLGDNTNGLNFARSSPVQTIATGSNWKQVACGTQHTAAIKTDGTLWLCGYNQQGQLGDNTIASKSSPVQTIAFGTNWKQVACGGGHTAAIKTDGTLWTWGMNTSGQLGDNSSANKSSPVQTFAGGTKWKQVACGATHTAAIATDGTLWLWGYNTDGELGAGFITNWSIPVQTLAGGNNWKQAAAASYHTAATNYSDIGQVI